MAPEAVAAIAVGVLLVALVALVLAGVGVAFQLGRGYLEPSVELERERRAAVELERDTASAQHEEDLAAEAAAHAATAERFRWFAHAAATDPVLRGSLAGLGGGSADPDDVWAWVREHADPGPAAAPVEGGEDPPGSARTAGDAPAD